MGTGNAHNLRNGLPADPFRELYLSGLRLTSYSESISMGPYVSNDEVDTTSFVRLTGE
jgi:hypothetical protein